ncbi:MAG: Uma2 family endonuclease, partial [Leptolyngbyaceae cyanobacterium RU_5_1]|nr:Uma2 family endonuclease [Leptolyngbyaceae cyanobacterium RU_5_1]
NGRYEAIIPTDKGWLWSEQLGLYLGIHEQQLRWLSADGDLIPLPEEQERQAKEQAQQRAEQAQKQQERLAAFLRSQGIDPDQLPE